MNQRAIDEALGKAWDELEEESNESTEETNEESDDSTEEDIEESTEESDDSTEEESGGEEEETLIEAPQHWSQEDRDQFNQLDNTGRELLLNRYKSMEADYTRKTQDIAEIRNAIPEDLKQQIRLQGKTEGQYIRGLAAADQYLNKNPLEGIKWLMSNYGVSPEQLGMEDDDPSISALRQEITELKQQLQTRDQQTQSQALNQTIQGFAQEIDDNGNLKHPHFEKLQTEMAVILNAGKAQTLEDAYEQALWLDPQTRQTLLSEQNKKAEQEAEKRRKEKAKKAKKAKTPSSGTSTATEKEPSGDLRDELTKLYDQQVGE